jgi:hypothetical protein
MAIAGVPVVALSQGSALRFSFENVARDAGLLAPTVFGGQQTNTYLLETTGSGAALFDYDNDGWLDAFLVNGTTLEGFPKGQEPTSHLYRNRQNGTFEDVTAKAGLVQSGWGQGACAADYDNDGHEDLLVTYYDRDGWLDLFVANYIDLDLKTAPRPDSGLCRYKGIKVACGPPGLPGGKNSLFRNRRDGTFEDVSARSGITRAAGSYALGVSTLDFDGDGWTDLYVANDSNPATLYRNDHDGGFTDVGGQAGCAYSQDGKPQAGMGVTVGDFDRNGTMDVFKTNFAGDTSTLYANTGQGFCEDRTFAAGIGVNTRWLGWGTGFMDLDNDGWLDLFLVNGHVYPEVWRLPTEAAYRQRKVVYRNLANGRFRDVSEALGSPITEPKAGRGAAFGDTDNDGGVDVLVNNVHDTPDLYRLRADPAHHWLLVKFQGTTSNRSAIGARVRIDAGGTVQWQEVRGGGSYFSQNDLRVHFGLGTATRVDRLEVRWPNGLVEEWRDLAVDRIHRLVEGSAGSAPAP